jgi:hypothetical protein
MNVISGISAALVMTKLCLLFQLLRKNASDQLTYELAIDDCCKVALVKKEESTVNFER